MDPDARHGEGVCGLRFVDVRDRNTLHRKHTNTLSPDSWIYEHLVSLSSGFMQHPKKDRIMPLFSDAILFEDRPRGVMNTFSLIKCPVGERWAALYLFNLEINHKADMRFYQICHSQMLRIIDCDRLSSGLYKHTINLKTNINPQSMHNKHPLKCLFSPLILQSFCSLTTQRKLLEITLQFPVIIIIITTTTVWEHCKRLSQPVLWMNRYSSLPLSQDKAGQRVSWQAESRPERSSEYCPR